MKFPLVTPRITTVLSLSLLGVCVLPHVTSAYSEGYYEGYYESYYEGTYDATFTTNVDFEETLYVLDTISKGSGSFVIDHPVDPRNKLLYHSFVESPDAKNLYDGTAVLDAAGEVVVELPDYTSALNKDFRYQVKAIDQPAPNLYIKEEVANNQFTIAGGPAGARVSWQVTGIRQDPYILANPIIPVVEKGPNQLVDKGEYLFAGYESFGDKVSSFFEKALDLLERLWDIFMEFMLSLRIR